MDNDRNLLFGVLALQAELIDADRFAKGCALWAADKSRPLADVLVAQGWLTPTDRADVGKLLDRKLRKHGGDVRASLAEVTTDAVRRSLADVSDPELQATLEPVAPAGPLLQVTTDLVPPSGDRYTLSRLHATGGIGRVWLARDLGLGREVALKELRPDRAGAPVASARFLREARVTGQLEHPGIVPVYELATRPDDGTPFYTMRFVRGQTLQEKVANYHRRRAKKKAGPLELRELLTAFVGVCNAIAFAHSKKVIHRDLKPQNIVVGDFGEVMVLDWGLAKVVGVADDNEPAVEPGDDDPANRTVAGQVLGTPAYMAPEQAEGRVEDLNERTDVYGLGAVLYEILTGRPPVAGSETGEILRKVVREAPQEPRSVVPNTPPALEAVCLKALAKRRANRYPSAAALADDVRHWLADEPVKAHRDRLGDRVLRWARKHRSWAWATTSTVAAVALVACLAAVLIGYAWRRADRSRKAEVLARADAEARQLEAQDSLDRAKKNLRTAQDVVRDSFHQIAATDLASVPEAGRVRLQLGKVALTYNEKFLAENPDNVDVQWDAGDMYRTMGGLYAGANQPDDSLKFYKRSLTVFRKLLAASEDPARLELHGRRLGYRLMLAKVCREAGAMLRARGRHAEARPLLNEGLGRLVRPGETEMIMLPMLRDAWPADPLALPADTGLLRAGLPDQQLQQVLRMHYQLVAILRVKGQLLVELARLQLDEGRLSEALALYDRITDFFQTRLDVAVPPLPEAGFGPAAAIAYYVRYSRPEMDTWYLGWALRGRATALTALGRTKEADATYAEARRRLANHDRPDDRYLRAVVYANRGTDRSSAADLDAALRLLEPLAKDFRTASYRREYAWALVERARMRPAGERAAAEAEYTKARGLTEGLIKESGGKPAADDLVILGDALAGLSRLGEPAAAADLLRQAVTRYEEALAICPAHTRYRLKLDAARKK
jgi:tetratricopeptide (TPR) repeat protein/tRNA A-37 threonylcarbamoyl transferase component Bud32